MPDRVKVMKGLEICRTGSFDDCRRCPYDKLTGCQDVMFCDALALLKEQEAVEPQIAKEHIDGALWSMLYKCGYCGKTIDPGDRFCRNCGRPLVWEPPKEEDDG